jgi:NTE family protein
LRLFSLVALLMLGACASLSVPMNEPLRSTAGNTEYRLVDVNRSGGSESALVLVALSGGGKRSAAFAHGVLRGMQDIHVRPEGKDSTLLDQVDLLAGVSGGAFTAAHFGLYGAQSFESFPAEFLYPDIEAYIWGTFLLPWNWDWLVNPLVGTNDRMTEVYDRLMFHGATFADLARRGRPQVSINATDINFGRPFGFLPQTFDVICSDLASVPIARAVAASNGLPVLFGPVTLRSYRGPECPLPPVVPEGAWQRAQNDLRARALLETLQRYSDPDQVRWIHLMDGGISDNLALRVLLNDALLMEAQAEQLRPELLPIRRLLVISVNAEAPPNPNWPRQRVVSGLGQIISAATGAQISAYNLETVIAVEHTVENVVDKLRQARCRRSHAIMGYPCDDVAGKVLRVNLSDLDEPETRARLLAIRTGLTLPRDQVDELVATGETMIRRNAGAIAQFLESVPQPLGHSSGAIARRASPLRGGVAHDER